MSEKIVGYTYKADIYCPWHIVAQITANPGNSSHKSSKIGSTIEAVEQHLDLNARLKGINRSDHYSFDSDNFPKEIMSFEDYKGLKCAICNKSL